MGHCVDQNALQDAQQLWSVSLEFTPHKGELLLTDTQHTTIRAAEDLSSTTPITNSTTGAGS